MVMARLPTNWLVPKIGPKIVVPVGMPVAAGGMVWRATLPVEQLPLGRHACVSHEAAGPYGRYGGEEIGGVFVLGWLHPSNRTEKGALQVLAHIDFLTINRSIDERR
ncbi:hypothetical protein ABZ235_19755 [Streptomyces canus]|uniref:hypothetical protein n=1 Tax=Streptomyces canus TaxID=58343 RepID=UPI0033AD85FF